MAVQGRSHYPQGQSSTHLSGGGMDATSALQALIARESQAMSRPQPQMVAQAAAPARAGAPMASRRSGGGGPVTRYNVNPRSISPAEARSALEGRHSFVTNVKGGPQVYGGLVSSSSGPGAVYGGWQVDEAPGPTRFANLPGQDGPAFAPGEDPADRAMRLNSNLDTLSRARTMPLAGRR